VKAQVSIEFISLLSIALLASAILVTAVNGKAIQFSQSTSYTEAQKIAQKTAYKVDYVLSEKNTSLELSYNPGLEEIYNVTLDSGNVLVEYTEGDASFPTAYTGPKIRFNTSGTHMVAHDSGLEVK
jgi:hypothetical protein